MEYVSEVLIGLTIDEASKVNEPLIYIIRSGERIVYVGQTINAKKRFENYKFCICHNPHLNNWLKINTPEFDIYLTSKKHLDTVEQRFIKKYRKTIFNICEGGEYKCGNTIENPLVAKVGVHCPSSIVLHNLKNHNYPDIKKLREVINRARAEMSMIDRVLFEIAVAYDFRCRFKKQIENWYSYTEENITKYLDLHQNEIQCR